MYVCVYNANVLPVLSIIVINSHWEPPLSNATRLGLVMVRGEPGGGKEHELRRQSVPSLWGGGWGDRLGVCRCPF